MKFLICSAVWDNPNDIIKHHPCLNEYGFEILEYEKEYDRVRWVRNEEREYIRQITKEKRKMIEAYVTLDNIEQLIKLTQDLEEKLIIDYCPETPMIKIYDGYIE